MPTLQERRGTERLLYSGKIDVTWTGGTFQAFSADLSETGIFLETSDLLPVGTSVHLELTVSEAARRHSVVAEGRVARHVSTDEAAALGTPPGLGIVFEQLSEGETGLRRFLAERLKELHEPQAFAFDKEREHTRALVALPVMWGTEPSMGREGYLRTLSTSGAFLETEAPEPCGTHLYLWFELPSEGVTRSVRATAVVAFVRPPGGQLEPGMGLSFESSTADVSSVERFVDSRRRHQASFGPAREGSKPGPKRGDAEDTPAPPAGPWRFPRRRRLALLILVGVVIGVLVSLVVLQFID